MRMYTWFSGGGEAYIGLIMLFTAIGLICLLFTLPAGVESGGGVDGVDWQICNSWAESRMPKVGGESGCTIWVGNCMFFWLLSGYFHYSMGSGVGSGICSMHILSFAAFSVLGVVLEQILVKPYELMGRLLPAGSPPSLAFALYWMEVFGVCIRVLTLTIRLLANLLVGGILVYMWVGIWSGLFGWWSSDLSMGVVFMAGGWFLSFVGLIMGYEIIVSGFQAYLFMGLILHYFSDSSGGSVSSSPSRLGWWD